MATSPQTGAPQCARDAPGRVAAAAGKPARLAGAELFRHYLFRGGEVVVIEQWTDPFGCAMLRVASAAPGEEGAAAGMTEAEFLSEARAVPA